MELNKIIHSDALTGLKQLDSESMDCCVTSPPYYALRDYHVENQLGAEETYQEYLYKLIEIFNEVKRVLKKSGTCWVVMGDTYGRGNRTDQAKQTIEKNENRHIAKPQKTYFDKCLMMIPSRFAIQMIDNGWILRNDLIWWKPNCMPSAVKDRFTVDYEHIYFFSKNKEYYFQTQYELYTSDSKPVPFKEGPHFGGDKYAKENLHGGEYKINPLGRIKRAVWKITLRSDTTEKHFAIYPEELAKHCLKAGCPDNGIVLDPFMGSGTTAAVALKTNRKFIGIELNKEYVEAAYKRIDPYLYQQKLFIGETETEGKLF